MTDKIKKTVKRKSFKEELKDDVQSEVLEEAILEATIPVSKTGLVLGGLGLLFEGKHLTNHSSRPLTRQLNSSVMSIA
ncbi:MAG: hypothetical protein FE834_08830 [Gammaproteobacteria bacterium]|nr:hypothetical protein [Gammaproteobacteria bacterium]